MNGDETSTHSASMGCEPKVTCNTCLKLCATLGDGQGALAILKDERLGEGGGVGCAVFPVPVGGENKKLPCFFCTECLGG